MKVKAVRHKRLIHTVTQTPASGPFQVTDATVEEKRERLYNAIERTLAFMHRNNSTEALMERIRRHYPAPQYLVESSSQALERVGLPRLDAFYYSIIPALTRTGMSQQWGAKPSLDSLEKVREYVKTLYVGVHVECFYLIMLDRQGRLIRAAMLQRGAVDYTPFYLDRVLTVALREGARFVVLVHNHPGGTKRPSNEDMACTLRTLNALMPLRIPLLDHVIFAGGSVVSIRQAGLLPAVLWTSAQPGSRIVNGWLKENLNNS